MTEARFQPEWLSRPGDTVSALMSRRSLTAGSLAALMGRERHQLQQLLAGSVDIDDELAALLTKHLGGSTSFWHARQKQFNQALDRAADAVKSEAAREWLGSLPTADLAKGGWIAKGRGRDAIRSLCAYFGVSGPEEWQRYYTSFANQFSYRTSPAFENKLGALASWLRQVEIEADDLACEAWDPQRLRARVGEIRRLTKLKNPSSFIPKLRAICSSAGVALVFLRAPSGCRVSGATRFPSSNKALIAMSFRHLSDDHFWFTLFHEIGHLLLHGRDATFVEGEAADTSNTEKEANDFSAHVLIPPEYLEELQDVRHGTKSVIRFAVSIDVAPGIVVGQMQHAKLLGAQQLNHLKRRYKWEDIQAALTNP